MFLAALTDLAENGATDLESEVACVTMGLGSAGVSDVDELGCVGAGLGGRFDHMLELHVMKFKQAMQLAAKDHWIKAINKELERMYKHKVWHIPKDAKVLTSTWAMKKTNNGKFQARIKSRGYEQVDRIHYDADTTAALVVNEMTICIVFTLMVMAVWYAEVVDVQGAFLHGEFEEGTELYMEVPEGFEKFYPIGYLLLLLQTIYGLKQAAFAFWVQLLKVLHDMKFDHSQADLCSLWISWFDDCMSVVKKELVLDTKKGMMDQFDCDEVGELTEFVGCKLERDTNKLKFTQPVLMQSFVDEFNLLEGLTPAEPGMVLMKAKEDEAIDAATQSMYWSGVGKLIHMMKWSRPDMLDHITCGPPDVAFP